MVGALFDTNILIDYLNNVGDARDELARYRSKAISVITWIEVLVGAKAGTELGTRAFLDRFDLIGLDDRTAERAVELRRQHGIRLPDAVIWATAQIRAVLLVTRNTKDFPPGDPGVRIPYRR